MQRFAWIFMIAMLAETAFAKSLSAGQGFDHLPFQHYPVVERRPLYGQLNYIDT
jgi:hypothetical protein